MHDPDAVVKVLSFNHLFLTPVRCCEMKTSAAQMHFWLFPKTVFPITRLSWLWAYGLEFVQFDGGGILDAVEAFHSWMHPNFEAIQNEVCWSSEVKTLFTFLKEYFT